MKKINEEVIRQTSVMYKLKKKSEPELQVCNEKEKNDYTLVKGQREKYVGIILGILIVHGIL